MAILKNLSFAQKELVTQWGKLLFDENGEAEVSDEAGEKLATLKGFSVVLDNEADKNSDDDENAQETENTTPGEPENGESEQQEEPADEAGEKQETAQEDTPAAPVYTEEELNAKNVPQLKKIAKDMGLKVAADAKKAELVNAILKK
jgi:hypothetical protein